MMYIKIRCKNKADYEAVLSVLNAEGLQCRQRAPGMPIRVLHCSNKQKITEIVDFVGVKYTLERRDTKSHKVAQRHLVICNKSSVQNL